MSDPARDGYTCHGPMRAVRLPDAAQLLTAAWLCPSCGVWRHAFPREYSELRNRTAYYMELNLSRLTAEALTRVGPL